MAKPSKNILTNPLKPLMLGLAATFVFAVSSSPASASDDICVLESNFDVISCLSQRESAARNKLSVYLEKLRTVYRDPSYCHNQQDCEMREEALNLLLKSQDDWLDRLATEGETRCNEGQGWDQEYCGRKFRVQEYEKRLEEAKEWIRVAEEVSQQPEN